MHKQLLATTILCLLYIGSIQAQEHDLLNSKDNKRIAKAEKKIAKAESLVSKADPYKQKVDELKDEGASSRKINRYEKKANSKVILSASYYKEAYSKKYAAYEQAVKRNVKSETIADNDKQITKAKNAYKQGKKWRRKAENESNINKSVEYLFMANNIQIDAIKHLKKTLVKPLSNAPLAVLPEVSDTLVMDTLMTTTQDAVVDTSTNMTLTPDASALVADQATETIAISAIAAAVIPKENDIYFTVQISSSTSPLSPEEQMDLYSGDLQVIEHKTDSGYKYSVGQFPKYNEAHEQIGTEVSNGFVVAYKGKERISMRVAKEETKD